MCPRAESRDPGQHPGHQKGEDLGLALGLGDPATVALGLGPGTGADTHLALDLKKDGIEKREGTAAERPPSDQVRNCKCL